MTDSTLPQSRPRQVSIAAALIAAGIFAHALGVIAAFQESGVPRALWLTMAPVALPGLAIPAMLLLAILQGRNWSRYFLAIWVAYSSLLAILDGALQWHRLPITTVCDAVSIVLMLSALLYLFRPASKNWYNVARAGV